MKQTRMYKGLLCALALVGLWACSQDDPTRTDKPLPQLELRADGREVLDLPLADLEVGVDEEAFRTLSEARVINYDLYRQDINGNRMGVQRPAIKEGDEVLFSLLFTYVGSQEAPLIAEDIPFVWKNGKFTMKPLSRATIQLTRETSGDDIETIPHNSQEERDALANKDWCYAVVYKPKGSGFIGGSLLVQAPGLKSYKRADLEDEEHDDYVENAPATEEYDGTPTRGVVDLGGYPFASRWTWFDMPKLLKNDDKSYKNKSNYKLPTAHGLAPRGYYLMATFRNDIPEKKDYTIKKISLRSQYVSYKGELQFVAPSPGAPSYNLGDPVYYKSSYGDTGWEFSLQEDATETIAHGKKGRYYFFWGMFTHGNSPNYPPKIRFVVEGQVAGKSGTRTYTFPWYELARTSGKNNQGRLLLYTLGTEANTTPVPTPPGGGSTPPPANTDEVLNPFDYFSSNYVRSEDNVRARRIAEEVAEHERTKVQGVSTGAFYQSHSGNGNILRTANWTPKATALPNGRRWPSLSDWATFLPLSSANRTQTSKYDPNLSDGVFRELNKWWGMSVSQHPNFTKKVVRNLNDLDKQNFPVDKGTIAGSKTYEIQGGKEIVTLHTRQGSNYTMALGAEYIARTVNGQKNSVFYGKRFIGQHDLASLKVSNRAVQSNELNDPNDFPNTTAEKEIASRFPENSHLSAWRYEVKKEGKKYVNETLTIVVKYVYLGPQGKDTTIEQIATESWWQTQDAAGKVREMKLRTPRYHNTHLAVPHLTTSYYNNEGVALFIDDTTVWYEPIQNFSTNSSTDYYLKLAIDPTNSASGLGGN